MRNLHTHLPILALTLCLMASGLLFLTSHQSAHAAGPQLVSAIHPAVQAAPTTPKALGNKIFNWVMQLVTPVQIVAFAIGILMIVIYAMLHAIGDHGAMPKLWRIGGSFILIGAAVTIGKAFASLMGIQLPG